MDRLSTLDAEFLHLEDGTTHMHIAGIDVFEGPPPALEDLEALVASKMHLVPRYRQRVRSVPFEIGRPVWADDPHFNLRYHLRHTALPKPGDDAALNRLMGRLMSQPLDRNRPLWETWLVEGLPDDRWALICKIHHCMVDGIAGVGLLSILLDLEREAELGEPVPWEPAPEPNGAGLVLDAWGGFAGDVLSLVRRAPGRVLDPLGTLRSVGRLGGGLFALAENLGTTPPLSIEGTIGPHRVWASCTVSLDDVKRVRKSLGGTVNDVVLAAVTFGYRRLLQARGDDVDHAVLRTLVPVSIRAEDARGVPDNRVSLMLLELPVHLTDPAERLAVVRESMTRLKASHMSEAGAMITNVGDLTPPVLIGTTSRLITRAMHQLPQRSINTVTTNVPGPQFPLYCLGREMLEYRPYVPIASGVRVGTAILSYNGRVCFGITGDYDSVRDVEEATEGILEGMDQLLAITG